MGQVAPRLTDFVMEAAGRVLQESSNPGRPQRRDNLYAAREDGAERSSLPGGRLTSSLFLKAQLHPVATALTLLGVGTAAGAWFVRNRSMPFGASAHTKVIGRHA